MNLSMLILEKVLMIVLKGFQIVSIEDRVRLVASFFAILVIHIRLMSANVRWNDMLTILIFPILICN